LKFHPTFLSAPSLIPELPRSTAIVRQMVAVRFFIRKTLQWWFLTCYPEDLDPLDEAPQHVSLNPLDLNAKDPSAW
jgi:hypothetical protein